MTEAKTTRKRTPKKAADTPQEEPQAAQEAVSEPETTTDTHNVVLDDLSAFPLATKLAMIMADVGDRAPEGKNSHFSYKYFTDKQLSGIFQSRFARYGIIMVPEVLQHEIIEGKTNKDKTTYLTNLMVRFTFYDGATGETISGVGFGQGDDPGDKGANKAMTGATKYFLIKTFQIGGEADAEADDATDQRTTAPMRAQVTEKRPAKVTQSQPKGEVKKGGRQQNATEAQVMRIAQLSKELNINAAGVGRVVGKVTDSEVTLTEGKEREELRALLGSLSSDFLGEVVRRLEEAKGRQGDLTSEAEGIFGDMSPE